MSWCERFTQPTPSQISKQSNPRSPTKTNISCHSQPKLQKIPNSNVCGFSTVRKWLGARFAKIRSIWDFRFIVTHGHIFLRLGRKFIQCRKVARLPASQSTNKCFKMISKPPVTKLPLCFAICVAVSNSHLIWLQSRVVLHFSMYNSLKNIWSRYHFLSQPLDC